jgi:hypothetical protein
MRITELTSEKWQSLTSRPLEILKRVNEEVLIVKSYISEERIEEFKKFCLQFSKEHEATWTPCVDGCPDYHRIHNNYPNAYVPSVQHAFYFHPWNENSEKLKEFQDIFSLKAALAEGEVNSFMTNLPSQGPIARLVCHQYPKGGGGQEEHIDPVSPFARVQTIIQASKPGADYFEGGLYVREKSGAKIDVDKCTEKGDLVVASPGIRHGVAPIDPAEKLDWASTSGRWIIMPIIIYSDHIKDKSVRPLRVTNL